MADAVESFIKIINSNTGLEIPEGWVPYISVAAVALPAFVPIYLMVRRWTGDLRAISGELDTASKLISGETSKRLKDITDRLEANLSGRLDAIHSTLIMKTELEAQPADKDFEAEPAAKKQSQRGFRIKSADAVRARVMEKWLEGRDFKRTSNDPNCYFFAGYTEAKVAYRVVLSTPYRASIGDDGRLPFALDVWLDGRKQLNFEWDTEGKYAIRGFTKGDWIEDLSNWNVTSGEIVKQQAA
jgi:hypothetical protein